MTTKQDPIDLWKGEFGEAYRERNEITQEVISNRMIMWRWILKAIAVYSDPTVEFDSILEVGAGNGSNIIALHALHVLGKVKPPNIFALEPNKNTQVVCNNNCKDNQFMPIFLGDADNANSISLPAYSIDLVFTSGVLIHIPPDKLLSVMKEIYRVSKKYIICIEYFSAEPREKEYYGENALWTCDFGSMWMDNFKLKCVNCFFMWKKTTGLDNLTVWIFEKVH